MVTKGVKNTQNKNIQKGELMLGSLDKKSNILSEKESLSMNTAAEGLVKDSDETLEKSKEKRFTLRLTPEAAETLDWISGERGGVSYPEVIRRALATEMYLLQLVRSGATINVEQPGSKPKQLVFL